jgi:hypothetical protein
VRMCGASVLIEFCKRRGVSLWAHRAPHRDRQYGPHWRGPGHGGISLGAGETFGFGPIRPPTPHIHHERPSWNSPSRSGSKSDRSSF